MGTEGRLLKVAEVIEETGDAHSVVFEVPDDLREEFSYTSGQFLTLAVPSDRTGLVARCYSLSSAPHEGRHQITVKRTVEGYGSNWVCDNLRQGDEVRLLPPSGIFTPKDLDADFLLFAGGSGITPVISIAKSALERGSGRVVLFYANRDQDSVIFADELTRLALAHPDRFLVVHWLESVQGLPNQDLVRAFASHFMTYDAFVCGPAPFMKGVVAALKELDFPRARRHQEKFASLGGNPFGDVAEVEAAQVELALADAGDGDDGEDADGEAHEPDASDGPGGPEVPAAMGTAVQGPVRVEVELDGEQFAFDDWDAGTKLLEHLESKGVKAPFSCREGECSACAVRLLEGEVKMLHNDVLEDEDLEEGIRLACQSLPVTDVVKVTYH